ncbi:G-box-binding factor-like [Penaeus japonicus]|uniref:G-box-binding factor-like n=1 Tax=Penaeus japonicus TaxID=27405 RepID=UPI001C713A28|nr:G-box-binding factor-like [Penaeus japonicus]
MTSPHNNEDKNIGNGETDDTVNERQQSPSPQAGPSGYHPRQQQQQQQQQQHQQQLYQQERNGYTRVRHQHQHQRRSLSPQPGPSGYQQQQQITEDNREENRNNDDDDNVINPNLVSQKSAFRGYYNKYVYNVPPSVTRDPLDIQENINTFLSKKFL